MVYITNLLSQSNNLSFTFLPITSSRLMQWMLYSSDGIILGRLAIPLKIIFDAIAFSIVSDIVVDNMITITGKCSLFTF